MQYQLSHADKVTLRDIIQRMSPDAQHDREAGRALSWYIWDACEEDSQEPLCRRIPHGSEHGSDDGEEQLEDQHLVYPPATCANGFIDSSFLQQGWRPQLVSIRTVQAGTRSCW